MAVLPASSTPTISPAEMQILVSRAGLVLNPGQVADLVLAWRQIAGLIAGLPADRPMADDMAFGFRLPPPAATSTAARPRPARPTVVPATAAPQSMRAKAKAAPPAKATAKPATKSPARRGTKRGR